MNDAIGIKIVKGDFILYTNHNYLNLALVIKVTQGQVWYRWDSQLYDTGKVISSDHIIIIADAHVARLVNEYYIEPISTDKITHIRSAAAELIEIKQKMIDDEEI